MIGRRKREKANTVKDMAARLLNSPCFVLHMTYCKGDELSHLTKICFDSVVMMEDIIEKNLAKSILMLHTRN